MSYDPEIANQMLRQLNDSPSKSLLWVNTLDESLDELAKKNHLDWLVDQGLVESSPNRNGFEYRITFAGTQFVAQLDKGFLSKLKRASGETAKEVAERAFKDVLADAARQKLVAFSLLIWTLLNQQG